MAQGCIALMCGLPGCGKSTLACLIQTYATHNLRGELTVFRIHYDKFLPVELSIEQIQPETKQKDGSLWKSIRCQILSCVDSLLRYLITCLDHESTQQQGSLPDTEMQISHVADIETTKTPNFGGSNQGIEWATQLTKPSGVDDMLWQRFTEDMCKDLLVNNLTTGDRQAGVKLQSWVLVIDDNMYYGSMRYDYCKLARKYNQGLCILHVSCDLEVSLGRNAVRSEGKVEDSIIRAMWERFEAPDAMKRPWEKHTLMIDGLAPSDLDSIFHFIKLAREEPMIGNPEEDEEGKNRSRYICSTNVMHQADQILRKCLAKHMAALKDKVASKDVVRLLASRLSNHRKDLLEKLRQGIIAIPFDADTECISDCSKDSSSKLFVFIEELFENRCDEV